MLARPLNEQKSYEDVELDCQVQTSSKVGNGVSDLQAIKLAMARSEQHRFRNAV